ncbi:MAG: heavy metal-binding domain-containing protein [Myxococcota bacterium]|nr:heavy metal-binding domain-containing protein [Myxococcota bacterium]
MELLHTLRLAFPLGLLLVGFAVGQGVERAHLRGLRLRETRLRRMPTLTDRRVPAPWRVEEARLVSGSVVVSLDCWKRFLAGLRALVGGRVRSFESLLERARREALLRMREEAHARGCHAVVGVRLHTARLAGATRQGKGTVGVEVLAFGTALRLRG